MRTIVLTATLTLTLGAAAQSPVTPAIGHRIAHKTIRPVARFTRASLTVRYIESTRLSPPHPALRHQPAPLLAPAQPGTPAEPELTPTPFSQNPIAQLRGNARALIIFAPDTANTTFINQLALLERNELFLSESDAILVPIVAHHHNSEDVLPGENIYSGNAGDQLAARLKFGINTNDFAIILLDKDGTVQLRSTTPVTVANIEAHIDRLKVGPPGPGE